MSLLEEQVNKTGDFCPFINNECVRKKCMLYTRVADIDSESELWTCALVYTPLVINDLRKEVAINIPINLPELLPDGSNS